MVDIDMEMNIIHCNNPEENPIPEWLRKKKEPDGNEVNRETFSGPVYPSFCRPIRRGNNEK